MMVRGPRTARTSTIWDGNARRGDISVPAIKLRASGSLGSRAAYAAVIGPGFPFVNWAARTRSSGTACIYHRPISAWFSSLSPLSCCDARGAARSDQFDARAPGDSSPDRSNLPSSSLAPTRPASPTRPSGPAARHRRRPGNGLTGRSRRTPTHRRLWRPAPHRRRTRPAAARRTLADPSRAGYTP
jgi:hypothetical protein